MKIGVLTFGCDGARSGIGQYTINLLHEFASLSNDIEFEILTHRSEKDIYVLQSDRFTQLSFSDKLTNPMANLCWQQVALPHLCIRKKYDLLFFPAANRRIPFYVPCPTVGTVHDFSTMHIHARYDVFRVFYQTQVLPLFVRRLTRVIAVSESTKRDIIKFARVPEERVCLIANGVNTRIYFPRPRDSSVSRVCLKHGVCDPYLLYVSRIDHPSKNHIRLIRTFERLKATLELPHQLVLIGSDWYQAEEVHRVAERSLYSKDIVFTGFVAEEELPYLYSGANVFIYPSLYEGFGIPLLEAMASGVPVACSNVSSLPEVAGDAALLFDPYDEESIAEAIKLLLYDPELHNRHIQKGLLRSKEFDWKATASSTLDLICDVAAETNRSI